MDLRDEVYNICLQGWSSRGELLSCICSFILFCVRYGAYLTKRTKKLTIDYLDKGESCQSRESRMNKGSDMHKGP